MVTDIQKDTPRKAEGVAAVDRALSILHALEQARTPLTISDLSRATGLYKSTALRLLGSLRKHGHVVREEDGRYALGPALLRLGMVYQHNSRLDEKLMPIFRRLVAAGSESPSFFVRQGEAERLCVFRLDSNHSTLDRIRTGIVLPLDRGAAGHIISAFGARAEGDLYDRVRAEGVAVSMSETSPDCAAVAAPVFDERDTLAGALSISGPRLRFDAEGKETQLSHLREAAAETCRVFGGRYPF
ncbi:IclR family transcriptional regulator (plasmid) [Roseivivax marinus]|uniref:IclR family transcriptional regulator n=1 Tax=Roseivivax marinus TaxID=1379903 RepID=UPI001F039C08|nr:IclR family transcriptional regulator [Roseivivax marinus]UMA67158.1 IclR family transcriptional regulator [Roseivivax marinus]